MCVYIIKKLVYAYIYIYIYIYIYVKGSLNKYLSPKQKFVAPLYRSKLFLLKPTIAHSHSPYSSIRR